MKSSKLYYYIQRLSPTTRAAFLDYLDSPVFNRDSSLHRFWIDLSLLLSGPEAPDLSREEFFAVAFPGKKYDPNLLRVTMSRVLDALQQYLAFRQWQQDEELRRLDLLRALNAGRFDRYFEQAWTAEAKLHESTSSGDSAWYRRQMDLEFLRYEYLLRRPATEATADPGDITRNLDRYYLLSRLGYACLRANRAAILPGESGTEDISAILQMAEDQPETEVPLLHILLRVYRCLTEPEASADRAFGELRSLLDSYLAGLSDSAARGMVTYAINYAMRQVQKGRFEFQEAVEALFRVLLDRKLLDGKRGLFPGYLKQIVTVFGRIGAQSGDFKWVDRLLGEARLDLPEEEAADCLAYNAAVLQFYRGKYLEAARTFQRVRRSLPDEFYHLDARAYLMMCFYHLELRGDWGKMKENEGFSGLREESDALRMYLRRQEKVAPAHHQGYRDFNRYLKQIVSAQGKPAGKMKSALDEIREALGMQQQVPHKSWLLARLED